MEVRGPFSSKEIERIYHELMASDFYDEGYMAELWEPAPYDLMGNIIQGVLHLPPGAKALDLGCGRGFLTLALRRIGLEAVGVEFSRRMHETAPAEHRHAFRLASRIEELDLSDLSLVTSLEVFEHLPMSITMGNLAYMHRTFRGDLFLTIPSFGFDRTLPGVGFEESGPERLSAMADNVVCPYLVYDGEAVSGGHITLAGYRFWEDLFLSQGFARQTDKERRPRQFTHELSVWRWCPYILKPLREGEVMFGRGWGEDLGGGRSCGAEAEISFITSAGRFHLDLDLELPDHNRMADATLRYSVEAVVISGDYRMVSEPLATGVLDLNGLDRRRAISLTVERGTPAHAPGDAPHEDGAVKPFTAYRVRFSSPVYLAPGAPQADASSFRFHSISLSSRPPSPASSLRRFLGDLWTG
jgi:SAM-dependent methyltransferase